MPTRPRSANLKRRIPELCPATTRGFGWQVNDRAPRTAVAKKHRFNIEIKADAGVACMKRLARHLAGEDASAETPPVRRTPAHHLPLRRHESSDFLARTHGPNSAKPAEAAVIAGRRPSRRHAEAEQEAAPGATTSTHESTRVRSALHRMLEVQIP